MDECVNAAKCQQFSGSSELLDAEVLGGTGSGCTGDADPAGCPQKHRAREL